MPRSMLECHELGHHAEHPRRTCSLCKEGVMPRCYQCQNGDHEDYDQDVRLVIVRDPDGGDYARRGYLCGEHRELAASDGYEVRGG